MKPVYIDLHIHTSENPSRLNQCYDLDMLIKKVREISKDENFLISFTDHNTINEKVYLEAVKKIENNLILGVELHIKSFRDKDAEAYHCHIYFNLPEINHEEIVAINQALDGLYPDKNPQRKDENLPIIEEVLAVFDNYDFILLPHSGQTHSTFDESLPKDKNFDNTVQRNVYYNFFDGFTSRSNVNTMKDINYYKRLGISEFINLITCTDNYKPEKYPEPRDSKASPFIPTWMLATPSFDGLRMSLSESSRLVYSHEKPKEWRDSIKSVRLKNENIDIDITLTAGLNVIIGESSSGKTLLVDSLNRKITGGSFDDSDYEKYKTSEIEYDYPDKMHPHFIRQNFILNATSSDNEKIKVTDIDIIKKAFPEPVETKKKIENGLAKLNIDLGKLLNSVEKIEDYSNDIVKIPAISSLISSASVDENPFSPLLQQDETINVIKYTESEKEGHIESINQIENKLSSNPFVVYDKKAIENLKEKIQLMRDYASLEEIVSGIIINKKDEFDVILKNKKGDSEKNRQAFVKLLEKMSAYYQNLLEFQQALKSISEYSIESESDEIKVVGHTLYIQSKFKLNKSIIIEKFNKYLTARYSIKSIEELTPEMLFKVGFKQNPKIPDYDTFRNKVFHEFVEENKITYKIITPDNEDFDNLSPGRQTSIILELLLNYEKDSAPLIIDQPEDNLATSYMNSGLVKAIKKMKNRKQIIFVSHNATIPMSGDAQNIILCENKNGKITIRSSPLEGKIDGVSVVDHIARIADGGKSSIKKRFKKYNLKKFIEEKV